jgi:alkylation response protein AidB-like acyl-CoA dehydrogenase
MQFGLNESQQILQSNARRFFAAECPMSEVRRISEQPSDFDAALWNKMAEQGYTGAIVPEEYGGHGLGCVELALLMEEMGRALVPGPFASNLVATIFLETAGSDEQKRRYLPGIADGSIRGAAAAVEPNATLDPGKIALSGAAGALTGTKLFITGADSAQFFIIVANDGVYLVANGPRISIEPLPHIDLARHQFAVHFDDAPAEPLPKSRAFDRAVDISTMAIAAETVGGMQRVLDLSVEYAKTRKQFGNPIGKYQAVQHMCADSYLETESARSAVYFAAWALQENVPEAATAVSVAKMYASDASRNVGNRGIQVHGGMGFTWENPVHLYYRRFKTNETTFGDATYHRERIAKLVIDARQRGARA